MNAAQIGSLLASWALRRPVTTCMMFLSMLLLGAISSRLLPLEKFPGIEIPEIVVQVPYPNSTPAEVERLITRPLEEALATLSNVKRMRSTSTSDSAQVLLQFDWGQDINAQSLEAREKVDAVKHLLPDDIERVLVFQFNTEDMPVFQLRISSQRDLSNAYDLLDRSLRKPLERVDGVSRVTLYGVEPQQIVIRLNQAALLAHQLAPQDITKLLQQANFSLTAGYIENNYQRILVNPVGEFQSQYDIGNFPIRAGLKLRDIATIEREMPRKVDGRHLDQRYAIGMEVFKESSANLVDVSARVMKVVEEIRNDPQFNGINLFIMDDTAKGVTTSLSDLVSAGLLGALLSFIVLYAFLRNIVTTLVVVLSVPIAICIALGGMYFLGYSLNVLSLMGLMLAVGMLVDNAVVITESIQHEYEQGLTGKQATITGVGSVSLAVVAGTLTTAIVFLPNIFGSKTDLTIFLEHTAVAICLSLLASLLLSQTLVPLLITKLRRFNSASLKKNAQAKPSVGRYQKALEWSWRHPVWTGVFAVLMLLSIAVPFSQVSGDEGPQGFNDRLFITYNLHTQYSLAEVEDEVTQLESYLYANQDSFDIDAVYSYYTPNYAISTLLLKENRDEKLADLMERIRADMPTLLRSEPKFGFGGGREGVRVTLSGQSTDVLQQIATDLLPRLAQIEGLTDVQTEMDAGQFELVIRIDRERVHRLGLSSADIARTVATALRGQRLRSYRGDPNGEIDLRVAFAKELEFSLEALYTLPVMQADNRLLTLQDVATITKQPRLGQIRRTDRRTSLNIDANLNGLTVSEARDKLTQVLNQIELPQGYQWSLDGSFQRQQENQSVMLVNTLLAVALIYIVMAALFESILLPTAVITSLLFSIVGVFWALMVTGQSISIMAMIGILILMGIVVNNGIVLVDRINQLLEQGATLERAIIDGSVSRLRPILMTVSTTVLGLVPLAFGTTQIGGDGPPYAPMAIAIIGGLVFSTVTSLFLVPYAYARLLGIRARWQRLRQRAQAHVSRLLPG
ncbi:efflux RND transporter permease subunit [Pseudidiomarina donghaiensis]|uniref:AcrB/AcrD/AcrF family protein n=1 Tax=Pseudidiomarina donghaiensis TaxID=519452 RepID=A0A432XD89_9GAMM|nr:efflux RND transporter permease subunit [Pseudidiomarina donghaiensis]RUO46724.1 AcrB/AcrD/AcrF family protein [Pseudidiomarina donghaiensis]SFV24481.1 Multidrug efflux pump subunit AcrB [Pseudidiomarina donghaiensis]